jgi:hypothetical protein
MKQNYLLPIGICAALLMIGLAPEFKTPEDLFYRLFFLLGITAAYYVGKRYLFMQRYSRRLKTAFNSKTHRLNRWWFLYGQSTIKNRTA